MTGIDSYGELEVPEEKSEVKVDIKQGVSLSFILEKMHSDENRIKFLEKIYRPGNMEVADLLLYLTKYNNTHLLDREIDYALQNKLQDRLEKLAKKRIDMYIENGHDILLINFAEKCNNEKMTGYAIKKLESVANTTVRGEERKQKPLEYSAEIAEHFGMKEKQKECLEKAVEIMLNDPYIIKNQYYSEPARICEKLERYEQAIDLYLKCEGNYNEVAFRIAEKYSPNRTKKIAEKGYKRCKEIYQISLPFLEFAEVIGQTEDARKYILNYTQQMIKTKSYIECVPLVDCLIKLNEHEQAKKLVEKIADNADKLINQKETLPDLYAKMGETEKAKKLYFEDIKEQIRKKHNPLNILSYIEHAFNHTKDKIFLEKKIEVYEKIGDYKNSSQTAKELGNQELADVYELMDDMVKKWKE